MLRRAAHVYEGKESTVEESVRVSRALGLREEETGAGARENGSREVQARRKQTDRVGLPWGWTYCRDRGHPDRLDTGNVVPVAGLQLQASWRRDDQFLRGSRRKVDMARLLRHRGWLGASIVPLAAFDARLGSGRLESSTLDVIRLLHIRNK
ncbi:hypothetical protein MRX96_044260 [Rhipicephalus microplus]